MNKYIKALVIGLVILYAVSPMDALPGPIDDLIVMFLGTAINKIITEKEKAKNANDLQVTVCSAYEDE